MIYKIKQNPKREVLESLIVSFAKGGSNLIKIQYFDDPENKILILPEELDSLIEVLLKIRREIHAT